MSSAEMTGLSFDIETSGYSKAINQLNKLSTALGKLSNTVNESSGTFDKIGTLATSISKLNGVKISSSVAKQLENISGALHSFSNNDVRRLQKISESLSGIGYASGMAGGGNKFTEAVNKAMTIDEATEEEEKEVTVETSGASESVSENKARAFEIIGNASKEALGKIKNFGIAAAKAGVQFGQLTTKLGLNPFAKLKNSITSAVSGLAQFLSSIKRIAMYRAIRFVISQITQGLKEGVNNLYQYSKAINGTFADSMDKISTSLYYLKNSIGAAVSPLLEQLAPAIDVIVDKVVTFINAINQVIAALTGSDTYTVAKKISKEYSSAADSANSIQKSLMGFDEINRLNSNSGSGSSGSTTDYGSLFTDQEISKSISDFAEKIKKYINKQDWEGLGKLFAEKINGMFPDNSWWEAKGKEFGSKIDGITQTIYYTLKNIDFKKIGSDLASWLNGAMSEIDFSFMGRLVVLPLTKLGDFIIGALETVDWKLVGKSIGDFFGGAIDEFADWLMTTDWTEVVTNLQNALIEYIEGVSTSKLGNALAKLLVASIKVALEIMVATSPIYTWYNILKKKWDKKAEEDPLSLEAKINTAVGKWWSSIKKAWNEYIYGDDGKNLTISLSVVFKVAKWVKSIVDLWNGNKPTLSTNMTIKNQSDSWWSNVQKWWGNRTLDTKLNIKTPKSITISQVAGTLLKSVLGFTVKWNAKGGILNGAQLFGMNGNTLLGGGEAGKEAVLPLESHTEWMDVMANRVTDFMDSNSGLAQAIGAEVYNAIVNSDTSRPININVVSQIDKTAVGKASIEYHNGVVTQTGMSPLTI